MSNAIMSRLSKKAEVEVPAASATDILLKLLATEYQAVTMYNSAYYWIRGKDRMDLIPEYEAHKKEEADHAEILEELLLELGGDTFKNADEWKLVSPTEVPTIGMHEAAAINQVIEKSEIEAVELYTAAVQYFQSIGDEATAHKLVEILKDEREHLKDVRIDFMGKTSAV